MPIELLRPLVGAIGERPSDRSEFELGGVRFGRPTGGGRLSSKCTLICDLCSSSMVDPARHI